MRRNAPHRSRLRGMIAARVCRCALLGCCAIVFLAAGKADVLAQSRLRNAFDVAPAPLPPVRQASAEDSNTPFADDSVMRPADSQAAEILPVPRLQDRIPVADDGAGEVQLSDPEKDGRIELVVRDASLSRVLALLAQEYKLNIVAANDIDAIISITLRDVPIEEALSAILSVANYTWVQRDNIILITSLTSAANLPANVQGRHIQVFDLDYVSATSVMEAVTNFLSPIGKVTIAESNPVDNRMTYERIVVEDLPESLARIAAFICQVDRPPRQVLIEAHVLQVTLDDTCKCGVNFNELLRLSNADLTLSTSGFADADASPAFLATLKGGDLGGVIEALQATTDTKTLGSPKVLVLNEQEARIQVGETLYYTQTTTTETSSQQGAGSIETGVILTIVPRITRDGRVLLHVAPEVSSAGERETPDLPPDTTKTELETAIMLEDGQGMIIGGLIKEIDSVKQSKVPYLGDVKGVGWLFRRSEVTKNRVEIIVALVPRIQPYDADWQAFEQGELARASVPLFEGPLQRTWRPWDPILPDGKRVYKPLIPKKKVCGAPSQYGEAASEYLIAPHPLPQQRFYGDGCVPEGPLPTLMHPERAFLSDEELPLPELEKSQLRSREILSDQP